MITAGGVAVFIVVGMLLIMCREHPSPVTAEQVEQNLSEHLDFFKSLTLDSPAAELPDIDNLSEENEKDDWAAYAKKWRAWSALSESRPDLMSHPALLGVWTIVFSGEGGTRASMTIKDFDGDTEQTWFDDFSGCLTESAREPEVGRASVRFWRTSSRNLVRYENRFLSPDGVKMGIRLILDPESLQSVTHPQNAGPSDSNKVDTGASNTPIVDSDTADSDTGT